MTQLTSKPAQILQELKEEGKLEFEESGKSEYWYELYNQIQQIINVKNELKEIMSNAKSNDIQILIKIHDFIQEIESVEKPK